MLMMEDQLQFESFIQQPGQEPFNEVVLVVVLSSVVESEHDLQVSHGGLIGLLSLSFKLASLG